MPNAMNAGTTIPHPASRIPATRMRESDKNTRFACIVGVVVAAGCGVHMSALHGGTRGTPRVARARQIAMYLAHVAIPMTLTDAGRAFGRDRTTAAHACRVIELARDNASFDEWLAVLERRLARAVAGVRP